MGFKNPVSECHTKRSLFYMFIDNLILVRLINELPELRELVFV